MPSLNPPTYTPSGVIRALQAGRSVPLDAPGWADTQKGPCPDCGVPVMSFKHQPDVRYVYGLATAHPHHCGRPPAEDVDHPHWLHLEAVNKELDELRRARIEESHQRWLP